jgi:hypothetical protein
MKKFLLIFVLIFSFLPIVNAEYTRDSISSFVNSISLNEINSIEDKKLRFCEKTFLKAYMRRDFSEKENMICRDIFAQKIEAQMNYMRYVFDERDLY